MYTGLEENYSFCWKHQKVLQNNTAMHLLWLVLNLLRWRKTNNWNKPLFCELEANAAPTVLSCSLSGVPPSVLSDSVSENQVN